MLPSFVFCNFLGELCCAEASGRQVVLRLGAKDRRGMIMQATMNACKTASTPHAIPFGQDTCCAEKRSFACFSVLCCAVSV